MFRISAIRPLKKMILSLNDLHFSRGRISCYPAFHKLFYEDFSQKFLYQQNLRYLSSLPYEKESMFEKVKRKTIGSLGEKTRILRAGCLAYEKVADTINYEEFFQTFNLPDTFQSWFLCIQLHVWMVALVTASENNGRIFRNSLVDAMWHDVEMRLTRLAEMKSSTKKKYLNELESQFQAALISYDEGIFGDDTNLAASAWRTLFAFKVVDPQMLENSVLYIRKQLSHLDGFSTENIMCHGNLNFMPLNSILSNAEK